MAVRDWYIKQATHSYSTLCDVINELTEEEVLAALQLESQSCRRSSVIDRLIGKAVRLNELSYTQQLRGKYNGIQTPAIPNTERSRQEVSD